MKYNESDLQKRCVRYVRREHPELQCLFFHVRNENSEGAVAGGRAVAEGVQAGVADLMLTIPNANYNGFAIEMKSKTGRQKTMQKWFQKYYELQGGKYVICKSYETFCEEIEEYLETVDPEIIKTARQMQVRMELEIEKERADEEKRKAQRNLREMLSPEEKNKIKEERKIEKRKKETEKARKRLAKLISRVG